MKKLKKSKNILWIFLKSFEQLFLIFNISEAISKQLTALIEL